jgi:hypothetical protein
MLMTALLNMILVSIPEEMFLVAMTLIFLKRFDLLDIRMWKQNLVGIMIPVLPVAILINVFRYIWIIPKPVATILNLIVFYILMVYFLKKSSFEFTKRDYRKLLIGFSLSFMILGLLEGLTVPVLLFLLNKSLYFLQENVLWNIILSIPSRVIELLIVIFLAIKNNNVVKVKIFETISKNNFLLTSIIFFAISSNIFAVYILKLIAINRILEDKISLLGQMFIIICVLLFPVIIIFWILLLINYLLVKEKQKLQTYKNLYAEDDFTPDAED